MAEQPSGAVTFRAITMLVFLIAIPLAAIFGTSLPDALKSLREGRLPPAIANLWKGGGQGQAPQGAGGEAPAFSPPTVSIPGTPAGPDSSAAPQQGAPPPLAPRFPGNPADAGPSQVVPAGYEAPIGPSAPTVGFATQTGTPVAAVPPSVLPADATAAVAPAAPANRSDAGGTNDSFKAIHQRLKELGATYYLLEHWGGQQQMYRFHCRMAVGGSANYTRYFEAIDSDPYRAMSQVMQQVEAWRKSAAADILPADARPAGSPAASSPPVNSPSATNSSADTTQVINFVPSYKR